MTYTQKTTKTYKNIKIVNINISTDSNPIAKRRTTVYVDNKIVTGHQRFNAMEAVTNAPINEVDWKDERNF